MVNQQRVLTRTNSGRMKVLANGDIVDTTQLPSSARNTLYKTELCKHFCDTGTCRYGNKCQFAHGDHELRGVLRHPKYKTTKCKAYSATGKCIYGTRCRFIHEKEANSPTKDKGIKNVATPEKKDNEEIPLEINLSVVVSNLKRLAPCSTSPISPVPQFPDSASDVSNLSTATPSLDTPPRHFTKLGQHGFGKFGGGSDDGTDLLDELSISDFSFTSQDDEPETENGNHSSRLSIFRRICSLDAE